MIDVTLVDVQSSTKILTVSQKKRIIDDVRGRKDRNKFIRV